MTNKLSSTFRIAGGLLTGLAIAVAGFVGTPGSASAEDLHRVVDTTDYVVWHQARTAESGDLVAATTPSFTPDGRQLVVTIKDGPPA